MNVFKYDNTDLSFIMKSKPNILILILSKCICTLEAINIYEGKKPHTASIGWALIAWDIENLIHRLFNKKNPI